MDRFKSILVAASPGSLGPRTLRAAINLAETNEARLTLLDVVAPVPAWHRRVEVEGRTVDVETALLRDSEERLRRLVKAYDGRPDTKVIVEVGEPFLEVIRHALADGNDLVILGERAAEKGEFHQLSSGVMQLLRKCPVPVWVMRPPRARKLRVLALVDPDPGDPVRDGLNDLVVDLAKSMTRREGGELHVGHAWRLSGEGTLRTSAYVGLPGPMVDAMVLEVEAEHRDRMDALAERNHLAEAGATIHMTPGEPRKVLPRLADQLGIGLIVMGTIARTGLSGLFIGNTAETILRSVRCSVLAVKPGGFVTPVKPIGKGGYR